jgi:ribosomal protein L11 methyltransferase
VLFRLVLRVPPEAADVAGALLVEEGAGGAVQEELPHEARVACFGEDAAALERLGEAVKNRLREGDVRVTYRVARAPRAFDGWATGWTKRLVPVRVSDTLWLVPTGMAAPAEAGSNVVWLEPALAFGFGEHPTTRLAAAEVELRCRRGARTVLDFGSGSGVLALVALHAGAARAVGVDIDEAAVEAARKNAVLNGHDKKSRFRLGGLARLRSTFDVVVANVDRATLIAQAASLAARVSPGGVLVLTGFLADDAREVARAYRASGFRVRKRARDGDWVRLTFDGA